MTDTELILKRLDEIERRIKLLQSVTGCSDDHLARLASQMNLQRPA